ncbi:hypothetical protein X777_12525 [Ooceraea biroi]|uniref:Uncharacterized protein n=1 Tax=Ooceraea biroi TaxID=2015173 RepID=A0A026VZF9_OOCBI|nr:hypothetical protein X777_12525 [Ooceraea biroi]
MALYNDKDTPGRLGAFRSTKGAALGSSYRTGTCFVQRGQMSPIMFAGTRGRKSQNNSRTEKIPSSARRGALSDEELRASLLAGFCFFRLLDGDDAGEEKIGEAVRWFRDESVLLFVLFLLLLLHPLLAAPRVKPLKNSDNTYPGGGAHLNVCIHTLVYRFDERIGESAILEERNDEAGRAERSGRDAQAGLSMPRHVLDRADYDIWVAQKPPMLIDRPR